MDPAQNQVLAGLLAACARRDQAAFARLYQSTSSKLFGVAVRILRREDWAEEVLQDCYVSIWNHAGSYEAGLSAPDFAPDDFEVDFKSRFTREDLSPLGLREMGY